uniref:HMG box domain-containing protein n=1 Tax=Corethrella appendiculata TaxID=1370023 RepID=U5EXP3_9DIPT
MPKKLTTNTKSLEARSRKETVKKELQAKLEKEKEDALWVENNEKIQKKLMKKDEEEKKKAEQLRKKAENKLLLEQEMSSIKVAPKISAQKVTRLNVLEEMEKRNKAIENLSKQQTDNKRIEKPMRLEENLNHVMADTEVAQTIDQAIAVLKVKDTEEDRHPEKRMKAAFKTYETENLPRLKQENPSLKLSQLKNILFKNWQKAPENPLNQNS